MQLSQAMIGDEEFRQSMICWQKARVSFQPGRQELQVVGVSELSILQDEQCWALSR